MAERSIPSRAPNAARSRGAWTLFIIVTIAALGADLLVKHLAFERVAGTPVHLDRAAADGPAPIPYHEPITVVPKLLSLKLTVNRGAAFGLAQGGRWIFVVIGAIAIGVIGTVFWRSGARSRTLHVALALLLAGAMGNLYDRLVFGVVRDMCWLFPSVELPFGWSWPGGNRDLYPWIFNVADAGMCVGLVLLLWKMHGRPEEEPSQASTSSR